MIIRNQINHFIRARPLLKRMHLISVFPIFYKFGTFLQFLQLRVDCFEEIKSTLGPSDFGIYKILILKNLLMFKDSTSFCLLKLQNLV